MQLLKVSYQEGILRRDIVIDLNHLTSLIKENKNIRNYKLELMK